MIEITESAQARIQEILVAENNPNIKLRTFVQGGGCGGFQYGFALDEDQAEDDLAIPVGDFAVLVDSTSIEYMQGSVIDYVKDIMGANFNISNPNAQSSCGCGKSFAC